MKYPKSASIKIKKDIEYMNKLIENKKPFNAKTYSLKEKDIAISSNCRKEWGYSIDISPDLILTENEAMELCQVIYDKFHSDKITQKLRETIEFLKVESIGGMWNTPQLIAMLEDLFKEKK